MQLSRWEQDQELLWVLPATPGGFHSHPPPNSRSQNPARQERSGRIPLPEGLRDPQPIRVWERSPKAGRGPLLNLERGLCFWASGQRGFRAALVGPRGLFSSRWDWPRVGIFWRGNCWERQQHLPLCAPLAAGVRDEGGWRVWGAGGSRLKGSWRFLGCPEGRDEGRMERVWGLAVPSNTKTLRGLSPAPRGRTSSLWGHPELQGEKPARSRAKQSREEPAGTAELRRRRDRNSPRQSQKR